MTAAVANRRWFWAAVALTALKLWLTTGQTVYAVGPAIHDDKLFANLAAHILNGDWLGPYDQFTLAKGPMFPLFLAGVFWLGLPLMLAQQIVYAGACATLTHALRPWLQPAGARFALYALLLWNPMSYDAGNLSRLMRQNLYTPLALLVVAGLAQLYARRREPWRRQAGPAALAGAALGAFWLTREESVWLLPAVGLLFLGVGAALGREVRTRWRPLAASLGVFLTAALLPVLVVCTLNYRHYGWFGTVEFRATDYRDAYGALTRIQAGPELPQVPVTRQMRERAYEVSPAFARLRPHIEGAVGEHWIERRLFPAEERQIRGGWFVWAIRDAMAAAGLAPDAGTALRHYRRIADEINAACDSGRVPARPPRSGFVPPLGRELAGPLWDGAAEYTAYFLCFRGFTAFSPDSVGDYADLKPIRDIVNMRLSHAPRSPDPFPSTQSGLEEAKVRTLEATGLHTARLLAWAGPLLLLVGLVRAVESVRARRIGFMLGLAAALLAACAAYLAINVLVHVTSFYNMSPAAMASAYPLYLVALAALATDALAAWNRPAVAPAAAATGPGRGRWLIPAGTALLVFAARLREVHLFGGDVPHNDQWIIEARQIIAAWLDGTLRPWTFFTPHFEHLPVWTRLLCWLQVVLTGRWDPLVQMTVNATLHATFIGLAARWVWRTCPVRAAAFVTGLLVLGGALPHAWENITWGFQSQFPLALLCLFLHVQGSLTQPMGSRGWWLAQAAALAGLFTLASMWLAPLAVLATALWVESRARRHLIAPAVIALLGAGLLAVLHGNSPDGQDSRPVLDLLHSVLHLLGWPSGLPGVAAVLQLPWLIHAWRLRGQAAADPSDRIIFALGAWSGAHALGLALARTGDSADYVSRYGDLLFIGVLAGGLALTRLVPAPGRTRSLFLAGAALWCLLVTLGLFERATEGHARYFHQTAPQAIQTRRDAVQAYLQKGDRSLLDRTETRWVLTQETDLAVQLLDRVEFRNLLPASVNPSAGDDALGSFNRSLQARWPALGLGSLLLLGLGLAAHLRWPGGSTSPAPLPPVTGPWFGRVALGTGLLCTAGLFVWNNPFGFDREERWRQLLGGDQAVSGMSFAFATPAPFGPERLQGAAPLGPVELRNRFFGTAPAGPEWTGTVLGSAFTLDKPWLVVPVAGYPTAEGNGLRLRLLDDRGEWHNEEIGCPGPNQDGVAYWSVDVSRHQGRLARLVLYDGRSGQQGWIAVAPPVPADKPDLAVDLARRLQRETYGTLHASFGIIASVAYLCAFVAWWSRRKPAS